MSFSYNPWLVSISVAVAILVSFTSLSVTSRVAESQGSTSRTWLVVGSLSMGLGIWSMHFIGMLATSSPVKLRYDIGVTLLSLGVAIITSGFAIQIASGAHLHLPRHIASSVVMGIGIVAMHYIGMSAISMVPAMSYDPWLVVVSIVVAVTASYVAIWLTFHLRSESHRYTWSRDRAPRSSWAPESPACTTRAWRPFTSGVTRTVAVVWCLMSRGWRSWLPLPSWGCCP